MERSVCAESSIEFSQESISANNVNRIIINEVFQCNLTDAKQVPVQAGDVLGLLLPPRMDTSFLLSVAGVSSKGPTNYVFESQELMSYTTVNLSDATYENNQLPQIAIDVESGIFHNIIISHIIILSYYYSDTANDCSKCATGFTDMPTFAITEVSQHTDGDHSSVLTILIPDMKFTYNATIAGFIVAGTNFNEEPQYEIQIWRQNSSQPGAYYKVQPVIVVNGTVGCVSRVSVVENNITFCILKSMAVSVQPDDFLGLEIKNDSSEIYFTSGGPKNYVFSGPLNSSVELTNNSVIQQQPQITFNLTSGTTTVSYFITI
jgi:hypothetical protein